MNLERVTCLICNWSSESQNDIENANQYGECLNVCNGTPALLRWDYLGGNVRITNTATGEMIDLESENN